METNAMLQNNKIGVNILGYGGLILMFSTMCAVFFASSVESGILDFNDYLLDLSIDNHDNFLEPFFYVLFGFVGAMYDNLEITFISLLLIGAVGYLVSNKLKINNFLRHATNVDEEILKTFLITKKKYNLLIGRILTLFGVIALFSPKFIYTPMGNRASIIEFFIVIIVGIITIFISKKMPTS